MNSQFCLQARAFVPIAARARWIQQLAAGGDSPPLLAAIAHEVKP